MRDETNWTDELLDNYPDLPIFNCLGYEINGNIVIPSALGRSSKRRNGRQRVFWMFSFLRCWKRKKKKNKESERGRLFWPAAVCAAAAGRDDRWSKCSIRIKAVAAVGAEGGALSFHIHIIIIIILVSIWLCGSERDWLVPPFKNAGHIRILHHNLLSSS